MVTRSFNIPEDLFDVAATSWQIKISEDYRATIQEIQQYRNYDNNIQPSQLNDRQKQLMGDKDQTFALNICPLVNNAEVDKMEVQNVNISVPVVETDATETDSVTTETGTGQNAAQPTPEDDLGDRLTTLANRWLRQSRWDQTQNNWLYAACRDGDSYLIPDYDYDEQRPTIAVNWQFDGDSGTEMVYLDGDPSKKEYAEKIWISKVIDTNGHRVRYRNIYLPDRILKMESRATKNTKGDMVTQWLARIDETTEPEPVTVDLGDQTVEAGVTWWTDNEMEGGVSLGIPVCHYPHSANGDAYGRSNLAEVVPAVQDAINLASASYMMAAQLDGFPLHVFTGVDEEEGKKIQRVPGAVVGLPEGATATSLQSTDLDKQQGVIDFYVRMAAMLTRTPVPLLTPTGQIAAEGTLQQQERPLVQKVKSNMVAAGNCVEDAIRMMFRLDVLNANESQLTLDQVEDLDIECNWKNPETKDETAEIDNAIKLVEKLGLPLDEGLRRLGFSEEVIQKVMQEKEQAKRMQDINDNAMSAKIIQAIANFSGNGGQPNANEQGSANPNNNGAGNAASERTSENASV